jgi:hypothetical protein
MSYILTKLLVETIEFINSNFSKMGNANLGFNLAEASKSLYRILDQVEIKK